jgi:uncharacterized integral membrane protein
MSDPNNPGYAPQGSPYPSGPPNAGYQPGAPQQPQPPQGQPEPKRAVSIGQILGAILFILLIVFIVENSHSVPIRIIAGPVVHPPVWVAIVIAAVLGALIAALLRYRRRVGARRKALVREHKSENR